MSKFNCNQCGKCCKWYSDAKKFYIELEDYERWEIHEREDILAYIIKDEEEALVGWYNPETNLEVDVCPFLEQISDDKWICAIDDTKPKHCRKYPLNDRQPEEIGCPGVEK